MNGVLVIALVLAMSGGAYAASKVLITSTKQISPKVLKELRGDAGPSGPTGPTGPVGSSGAKGETGPEGKTGTEGQTGPEGKSVKGETGPPGPKGDTGSGGESVEVTEFSGSGNSGGKCTEGGTELSNSVSKGFVCNGAKGAAGIAGQAGETLKVKEFTGSASGSKCTEGGSEFSDSSGKGFACNGKSAGGVLEKGKTERGVFFMAIGSAPSSIGTYIGMAQINFAVPLAASESPPLIELMKPGETEPTCPKAGKEAEAAEGFLCVYEKEVYPESGTDKPKAGIVIAEDPYGDLMKFEDVKPEGWIAAEWALTAK